MTRGGFSFRADHGWLDGTFKRAQPGCRHPKWNGVISGVEDFESTVDRGYKPIVRKRKYGAWMTKTNPYQPSSSSADDHTTPSLPAPSCLPGKPLGRIPATFISVISVVLLAFVVGETTITLVVTTPLARIAELNQEFDGLIIFAFPIFLVPMAMLVGILVGVMPRTRARLAIEMGLSILCATGLGFYLLGHESRAKSVFAIASVVGIALLLAVLGTHALLLKIAVKRSSGGGAGGVSALVAAILASIAIVAAMVLEYASSDFNLAFLVVGFLYIAVLAAAAIGSMYNLAAYRGKHWSSWVCLFSSLCSPLIFLLL